MTILDGNALAGALDDLLGADPTSAVLRCSGCGSTGPLALVEVHRTAMGDVARCRGCGTVLVTVVDGPEARWVAMPGTRAVHVAVAP